MTHSRSTGAPQGDADHRPAQAEPANRTDIGRRHVVRLGTLWLLASPLFRPFPEELNTLFGHEESPVVPLKGEILPFSVSCETKEESTRAARLHEPHLRSQGFSGRAVRL